MPQESSPVTSPPARPGTIVLAPGEKFFVRRVPLAPDGDIGTQVELSLEGLSPFPAGQLFHGFRTDAARTQALVFAAYRKGFSAEESAAWVDAMAVLPDFSAWLAGATTPAASVCLHEQGGRLTAVAWDGRSELPAAILVRRAGAAEADALVAEARTKAGLSAGVPVKRFQAAVETVREKREVIVRLAAGGVEARFNEAALGQADVRDKTVLTERRRTLRRDTLLWRGFATILGGLAACVVLELGLLAAHGWLKVRQRELEALKPVVEQINVAQSMAKRLEEISAQRVQPFEMLAELQGKRPKSIEFIRASTSGLWRMDIEGQTANAGDLRDFEADVRKLAAIEHVEVRDPRTREGLTTFVLEVTFKPGWLKAGGGA